MTLVRLEPAAPRSRVKHSTTEPLRSLFKGLCYKMNTKLIMLAYHIQFDNNDMSQLNDHINTLKTYFK